MLAIKNWLKFKFIILLSKRDHRSQIFFLKVARFFIFFKFQSLHWLTNIFIFIMTNQFKRTRLNIIFKKHSTFVDTIFHNKIFLSVKRLQSHLQWLKSRSSYYLKDEILNLTFENEYLRAQLIFSEKSCQILLTFQEKLSKVSKTIENALCEMIERLRETNHNYLKL